MNIFVRNFAAIAFSLSFCISSYAQYGCDDRIVYRLVYDEQEVTRYRVEYQTEYREREYTVRRPEWTTETRSRTIRVAKPVVETHDRVEKYTVLKPNWSTRYEERTVDKTEWVEETSSRVEQHTVWKPVDYTEEREESYRVRRPVSETVMQQYEYTEQTPVTAFKTQYVDRGGFVDQQVLHPGQVRNRLRWTGSGYGVDGRTGQAVYYRSGFNWVPQVSPGVIETRRHYVPNVVGVQVPVTEYRARTVVAERPVQRTRMEEYTETRKVPVTVRKWEKEIRETEVPTTVRKPIIKRVTYRIPIREKTWTREVMERTIPVTTRKYVYEDREEEYDVRVFNMVSEVRNERYPVTVRKLVPYTVVRRVPRRVAVRYPTDTARDRSVVVEENPAAIQGAEIIKEETITGGTRSKEPTAPAEKKPTISDKERETLELKKPANASAEPEGKEAEGKKAEGKKAEGEEAAGEEEGKSETKDAPGSEAAPAGGKLTPKVSAWRELWEVRR